MKRVIYPLLEGFLLLWIAGCQNPAAIHQKEVTIQEAVSLDSSSGDSQQMAFENSMTAVEGIQDETEIRKMEEEYRPFGLSYNQKKNQWYFEGEPVRHLKDVLLSNGEELSSGKFHGIIRNLNASEGEITVEVIRDYEHLNPEGYGTIREIQISKPEEFEIVGKIEERMKETP